MFFSSLHDTFNGKKKLKNKRYIIAADLKYGLVAVTAGALILIPVLFNIIESSSTVPASSNTWSAISPMSNPSTPRNDGENFITTFQADHAFKRMGSAGSQEDDARNYVLGNQSLKLSTDGDAIPVFTRNVAISPTVNLTEATLNIMLMSSDFDNIKELRVSVTADRFETFRDYWIISDAREVITPFADNEWAIVTIDLRNIGDSGSPDLSKIDTIQLRVVDKADGPVSVWFNGLSYTDIDKKRTQ